MSHSRGWFKPACKGNYKKRGKARDGYQQWWCGRCGKVILKKVRPCFWQPHRWKLDRRYKPATVKCVRCGVTQQIPVRRAA